MNNATARVDPFDPPSRARACIWPGRPLSAAAGWDPVDGGSAVAIELPERAADLARDAGITGLLPFAMCHVTTRDGSRTGLEKIAGVTIVGRSPYVLALPFRRLPRAPRDDARGAFTSMLEAGGTAAVQLLAPDPAIDRALHAVESIPASRTWQRIPSTGLRTSAALTVDAPVFESACVVYEGRLVRPGRNAAGERIYERPWIDVGSHRIYFLEVMAVQVRESIAGGRERIDWAGLPAWRDEPSDGGTDVPDTSRLCPEPAFVADSIVRGMAVQYLDSAAPDEDNDSEWPCFFPSTIGMMTAWSGRVPHLMPCRSTAILSHEPLTIGVTMSNNWLDRHQTARTAVEAVRKSGRFGLGVPYLDTGMIDAIRIADTAGFAAGYDVAACAGLTVRSSHHAPVLTELPVHVDCALTGQIAFGSHVTLLGEIRRIRVRRDVTPETPLVCHPWPQLQETHGD